MLCDDVLATVQTDGVICHTGILHLQHGGGGVSVVHPPCLVIFSAPILSTRTILSVHGAFPIRRLGCLRLDDAVNLGVVDGSFRQDLRSAGIVEMYELRTRPTVR
jgi:hypothetical protein